MAVAEMTPVMNGKVIDGKAFAEGLRGRIATFAAAFEQAAGRKAGLAVVLVGEDPASQVYVRSKGKQTVEAGMASFEHKLPAETAEADVLALVERLNADPMVDGILVQLPLPKHIDEQKVISTISPDKDVDGFHVVNAGRLAVGQEGFVPCTPLGCLMLLKDRLGDLSGLDAVVIGRSNIVGKPMAQLLVAESCTVTVAHSRTRDLPEVVRRADIVVAAVGRPEMVKGDWIKPGATVIDVGINRVPGAEPGKTKLVGDVDYASASAVAGAITPVPGGVGPMTIAVLLRNTLVAAHRNAGIALEAGAL
jgi:methylenetetrahydrofolate dehydrogenase (NADP+)/methenyltetrahydrofolate cyclohydrolase